jgi:hypothetical protein
VTVLDAMGDPNLLGAAFPAPETWAAWRALLASVFALPLGEAETALYREHTSRQSPPASPAREAWLVVGRRGGKSRVAATVAVYLACFRDYRHVLAPGERGTLPLIACDRRQARTLVRYVDALLDASPMLSALASGARRRPHPRDGSRDPPRSRRAARPGGGRGRTPAARRRDRASA